MASQCSKCGQRPPRPKQRYCKPCHASWMREKRPKHRDLPEEARKRANARAYAHVYLKRGIIRRRPCERCGAQPAQMHHDDYSKPTAVRWLCPQHHHEFHYNTGSQASEPLYRLLYQMPGREWTRSALLYRGDQAQAAKDAMEAEGAAVRLLEKP